MVECSRLKPCWSSAGMRYLLIVKTEIPGLLRLGRLTRLAGKKFLGRCPCPVFGIGMINDDFHIAGIRQVVAERLKRVVMYSMALGPRCFKWKMLSLSGPKALLFLQLLIAFITRSVVNVRTISNGFLFVSLVTTLVSLEEVCLPSFKVLNCWLNLVASCLDDENEIPLKVIDSFSTSRFALPSIPLIVLHSLVMSVF